MAGLAATLNVPDSIEVLTSALGTRGADGVHCRLAGSGPALAVGVRAVMPAIARVLGGDDDEPSIVAAFAVDGVASVTALDAGYAARGPLGLLGGAEPYATILADGEHHVL